MIRDTSIQMKNIHVFLTILYFFAERGEFLWGYYICVYELKVSGSNQFLFYL